MVGLLQGDPVNDTAEWEAIHQSRHWGTYPDIHVVRQVKKFMAGWGSLFAPSALEVGCGAGACSFMMRDSGLSVTAFDGSQTAIENMRRRCLSEASLFGIPLDSMVADAQTVDFPAESFDFILDNFTLTYLEQPPWERILSWLKPGGWLAHASFEVAPKGTPVAYEHKEPGHVVERHTSWVEGNAFTFAVRKYVKPS
jgi:2-polyprenyl-3-methyl-5-hydroxy-6-metoxy-1,4-benzoquinol methylase